MFKKNESIGAKKIYIQEEAKALLNGDVRSWVQIGLLLHEVDSSGFWEESSSSFTSWLKTFATTIGLKEASLWRYMASVKNYKQLQEKLTDLGIDTKPIELLPNTVSPENIEILSKLTRVMPEDEFIKLAQLVITASITRDKMRETWEVYRPLLNGKNARGIGVEAPKINTNDSTQTLKLNEAQAIVILCNASSDWIGVKNPYYFEIFRNVRLTATTDSRHKYFMLDAVVAVSSSEDEIPSLHVIESKNQLITSSSIASLTRAEEYCDYMWVLFYGFVPDIDGIPDYIGILLADKDGIKTVRQPQSTNSSGKLSGILAKILLTKNTKR